MDLTAHGIFLIIKIILLLRLICVLLQGNTQAALTVITVYLVIDCLMVAIKFLSRIMATRRDAKAE